VYFKVWETWAQIKPNSRYYTKNDTLFPVTLHGNRLYGANLSVCMGPSHPIGGCSSKADASEHFSIEQWLAKGIDNGTTATEELPNAAQIVEWGKLLLGIS
jgi:hypothetical protein